MNTKSWFVVGLLAGPAIAALFADSWFRSGCDNPSSKVFGSDWCQTRAPRRSRY